MEQAAPIRKRQLAPMNSWRLIRQITDLWTSGDNPVFRRALTHPPPWYRLAGSLARATALLLPLVGLACFFNMLLIFYSRSLLLVLALPLLSWSLMLGFTLAPIVVEERQDNTWDTLRITPLSLEKIVIGKAAGALWWLRDWVRLFGVLVCLVAISLSLSSLILTPTTIAAAINDLGIHLVCGLLLLMPFLIAVFYIFDRVQQFVLMIVSALIASAATRTLRTALPVAGTATFIVWVLDAVLGLLVLFVLGGSPVGTSPDYLVPLLTLGPVVVYLATLPLTTAMAAVVLTLLTREIAVLVLWRVALRVTRSH